MFFKDMFKIIFKIWYWITIRWFKFFISCWSWYFKFIIFAWLFWYFSMHNICRDLMGKQIYHFFFNFIFCERLSMKIRCLNILRNIVSILFPKFYNFNEIIILLYTFLIISFAWYKEYIICLIWFSKISDVLPAFTCASAIVNLWRICLGIKILRPSPWIDLYLASYALLV